MRRRSRRCSSLSTHRPTDLLPAPRLVADTLRQHRVGIIAWVSGGAVAMFFMGISLAQEMRDFPGGATGLAATVMPGAEALRPLRWPADRLDTLGGYMTYHNILLFQGFLAIYAAIQGARAIRGDEERLVLEEMLAAGWSRASIVRDRALGFVIVGLLIWVGLAAGVAGALIAAGEPDTSGSFVSMAAVTLCMLTAYALAVLVSQFMRTSKAAAGITILILVVLYVGTNVWEQLGPLGVVRFASPFFWANRSRALVPGIGADGASLLGLALAAALLLVAAGWAFSRRDYAGVLWPRRRAAARAQTTRQVQHWWTRTWWTDHLVRHAWGLAAWAGATAGFVSVMVALQPTVMQAWLAFDFYAAVMGGQGVVTPEVMYTSFMFDILAPVIAAYAITQAAGWVSDLESGRVEQLLAAPMSWTRLALERLASLLAGVLVITLVSMTAIAIGTRAVDASVDAAGLGRALVLCLLIGLAMGGLALLLVAWLRTGVAVTLLAVYAGAAYLLTWMIPIFDWPDWTYRLSVFDAFGHPYQQWPTGAELAVLAVLGVGGTVGAWWILRRAPKVAGV